MPLTAKAEKANEIRAVPHPVPHIDRAAVRKYNKSSQTIECDLLEKRLKEVELLENKFKEEAIQYRPRQYFSLNNCHSTVRTTKLSKAEGGQIRVSYQILTLLSMNSMKPLLKFMNKVKKSKCLTKPGKMLNNKVKTQTSMMH